MPIICLEIDVFMWRRRRTSVAEIVFFYSALNLGHQNEIVYIDEKCADIFLK